MRSQKKKQTSCLFCLGYLFVYKVKAAKLADLG